MKDVKRVTECWKCGREHPTHYIVLLGQLFDVCPCGALDTVIIALNSHTKVYAWSGEDKTEIQIAAPLLWR